MDDVLSRVQGPAQALAKATSSWLLLFTDHTDVHLHGVVFASLGDGPVVGYKLRLLANSCAARVLPAAPAEVRIADLVSRNDNHG